MAVIVSKVNKTKIIKKKKFFFWLNLGY
jgi:hypothetical protein